MSAYQPPIKYIHSTTHTITITIIKPYNYNYNYQPIQLQLQLYCMYEYLPGIGKDRRYASPPLLSQLKQL